MSYGKVSSRTFEHMKKDVVFMSNYNRVDNIYALPFLVAGHDGFVFKYGDFALKLLKYDIEGRSKAKLMTFEKASYFCQNLKLKRVEAPRDVLLDRNGVFSGYVMRCVDNLASDKFKNTPIYKSPGDFTCGELLWAIAELGDDFMELSAKGVKAQDINSGTFLFPSDYVHFCDTDKYQLSDSSNLENLNMCTYNYSIAKLLYLEMYKNVSDKDDIKKLGLWVKQCANSPTFIKELTREIGADFREPIGEFANHKAKTLLH